MGPPWLEGDRMEFDHLKRREFITLLGGAAVAWPLDALAQQGKVWRMGFIAHGHESFYDALFEGLREYGCDEGIVVRELDTTAHLQPQHYHLTSERRFLSDSTPYSPRIGLSVHTGSSTR